MVRKVARPARNSVATLDPAAPSRRNGQAAPRRRPGRARARQLRTGSPAFSLWASPPRQCFTLPPRAITECLRRPGNGRRQAYPHMSGAEVTIPMTPSRLLLIGLTLWGLVMIVPDLIRVVQPLGSLGFFASSDG